MDEAEEVVDVIFPSRDESAEVLHPCEEPFHFPSPAISSQFASILSFLPATAPVGSDHFDVVFRGKPLVEGVRVVGFVADDSGGEFIKEAAGKNIFNKVALGRRSTFDRYGERKTVISGANDDLGNRRGLIQPHINVVQLFCGKRGNARGKVVNAYLSYLE
jgi:hypothetical protein